MELVGGRGRGLEILYAMDLEMQIRRRTRKTAGVQGWAEVGRGGEAEGQEGGNNGSILSKHNDTRLKKLKKMLVPGTQTRRKTAGRNSRRMGGKLNR